MSEWVEGIVHAMTIEEKIGMVGGHDLWRTAAVKRLGVPALKVTDGPHGVRGEDDNHGPTFTGFPAGVAMGATFDPDLVEQVGRALASEARQAHASVVLGPMVNIPRVPIAGRNFECFSEDPVLSGTLAGAYIRGVQSQGVAACLKHFVCNDQEYERYSIDARVDARTLHEIYLEPFRIAIDICQPWSVMTAYNTVNGVTASENPLLVDVLRHQYGFDGAIISDWYGTYSAGVVGSALDLEMPGPPRWTADEHWLAGLEDGTVSKELLDDKVRNILTLMERTDATAVDSTEPETTSESTANRDLARQVATQSMVLLHNNGVLPLAETARIALIGPAADQKPQQGGGSSAVRSHRVVSVLDGLTQAVGDRVTWSTGCQMHHRTPQLTPQALTHDDGAAGLLVEYFTGTALAGDPVLVAPVHKSHLGFFGQGNRWVDYDDFSLRMSGEYEATASGVHRFGVEATGPVRVYVGGSIVVDAWDPAEPGPRTFDITLQEGQTTSLAVEYASAPGVLWRAVELGCQTPRRDDMIADAVALAADSDVAVVVVGLGSEWESEGVDRSDMALPGDQDRLVTEVAAVQRNTIVLVAAGSPVQMPWLDEVAAVMYLWYGGQEIGHAVAAVLTGNQDPGGRLPVTLPVTALQHPGMMNYPGEAGVVRYGEGIYVGYRGFDRLGIRPQFEFGHGLSYTRFEARDVSATRRQDAWTVAVTVANTGDRRGTEVVAVYALGVGDVDRRLVAYAKEELEPGEQRDLELIIDPLRLRRWDPMTASWSVDDPTGFLVSGTFGAVVANAATNKTAPPGGRAVNLAPQHPPSAVKTGP